ncbi:MAG: serine/threonine-protein kinase [Acidobacteriota bacterium]
MVNETGDDAAAVNQGSLRKERWRQALEIFEDAVAMPESARAAWLEEVCGRDDKLLAVVEDLLAADGETGSLLDRPAEAIERDAPTLAKALRAEGLSRGTEIGPYRLLRRIGRGGMSVVYLAERADEAFPRRVAVKLIRPGMESRSMQQRLRIESRILAGLDHPYVARLFDGGTTAEGQPYFVMEYIEGLAIDKYCKQNRLSVDERLTLFRKVCEAVHYAHQNLIVHRDIKPSNILTVGDGLPKLLDFGIAKLLNPELAGGGLEPTGTWHRVLTPSYASPEQLRGQPITTASDVYSLGVVLYQLLTGRLPRSFRSSNVQEIEQVLTDSAPAPPSVALSEALQESRPNEVDEASTQTVPYDASEVDGIRRQLIGDLDAIVLKALRTEARHRYDSAQQLAADIERYQSGLPVEARAGNWRYRAGKFVRRHHKVLAATTAAILLLIGFAVTMTLQARRVATERDKKAEVLSLVLELFKSSSPYALPGQELTVREALRRSVPVLEKGLTEQPDVRAELLYTSGSILYELDADDDARDQLEEALAIGRQLYGEEHLDVAETMRALASVYRELAQYERAEELARQSVAIHRELLPDGHPDLCGPLVTLATILCYQSQFDAAEAPATEALRITQELPEGRAYRRVALQQQAIIESARGNHATAAQLNREALELHRKRYGRKHPTQIGTLNNLGAHLRRMDHFDEAEQVFEEAIALREEIFGPDHPDFFLLNNLAGVRLRTGNYTSAEELYRKALAAFIERVGPDHRRVFFFELRIARARIHNGQAVEAEAELRRLMERWRAELDNHWWLADGVGILGESLSVQGRCEEAERLMIESFESLVGNIHQRIRRTAFQRLEAHFERCDQPEKIAPFERRLQTK